MAFSRALFLKGLAGVATVGAVGGGVVLGGNLFKSNRKVNDKLSSLGLEGDCLLKDEDSTNFSKECSLDLEKLKKIRFSNKGEGELKVVGQVPQELKLKIEGNKEDISFSFKGVSASSPIAIFGDESKGKIVLRSEEQKFKDVGGKLTKDSGSVDETLKGFNKQLGTVKAPIECRFDEAETDASVECSVTEEDLKGIKFSGLGEGELNVKGEVSAGLKLKAERDQENVMSLYFTGLGENLTIYGDQKSEGIVIKSGKKFRVGEDGKLEKVSIVVTPELKAKVKEFNKQLEKVKAPLQCRFDEEEGDESVECPVSHEQLKKMVFSNKLGKTDLKIVGSVDPNLKLRVERDSENEMSLFFTGLGQDLTIYGYKSEGKIILKSSSETKFKIGEDGKLEKESISSDSTLKAKLRGFNKQLGTIEVPNDCRFDDAEAEESIECPITKDQFEKIEFSNKEDKKLNIVGWNTGNVKLRAEKDSASPDTMSISFPGISQDLIIYGSMFKGKIVVKGSETKFNVINNTLTKESSSVDEALKSELDDFNYKLGAVAAPVECRFDAAETEESVECSVTPEQLKIMAFSESEGESLTLSNESFSGMRLKVQIIKVAGEDGGVVNDLSLTFKGYDKRIDISGEDGEEIVSFVKGTNPEFGIYGGILEKEWDDPADFERLLGLACSIEDGETEGECIFSEVPTKINVGKSSGDGFEELTIDKTSNSNFELHAEEEGYNQGFKFVFKGETVSGSEGAGLEKEGSYEFRWKSEKGESTIYYLAKKEPR